MGFLDLIPVLGKVLDRVLPDKAAAEAAKLKVLELAQQGELAHLDADLKKALAASDIVKTEAASSHWLAANWRPLLMLTFGGLIVARWFGLSAPDLSDAEYLKLWDIVQLGLGGYVIGRSAEKIVPSVISAMGKKS
jgi:hypothetical protein